MEVNRSFWAEMTFLKILLFWLIIPVIIAYIVAKSYLVTITSKKIIINSGIINKTSAEYAVAGITSIRVEQTLFGSIFNYGTVYISLAGDRLVALENIAKPNDVKSFLNRQLEKTADAMHALVN